VRAVGIPLCADVPRELRLAAASVRAGTATGPGAGVVALTSQPLGHRAGCGFASASHFTNRFRQVWGTPGEYRQAFLRQVRDIKRLSDAIASRLAPTGECIPIVGARRLAINDDAVLR
jgi:hypothetical protein